MNKKIISLISWAASLGLIKSRDQYDNINFGTASHKHLFHFHERNAVVDLVPPSRQVYDTLIKINGVRPHSFYADSWLEFNAEDVGVEAKEILSVLIKSS